MRTIKQLRRLRKAYVKLKTLWIKSNDANKEKVIQEFNDSIEDIDLEITLMLLSKEDMAYLDDAS